MARRRVEVAVAAAALGAFALDLVLPHGIADGTLYIALVLSALWMPAGPAPLAMAAAASLLAALGFLVSPEGEPLWMALTDRGVSVAVIWVVAWLVHRHRAFQAAVERPLRELEAVYAQAPVGLCLVGPDLRYVSVNDRLAEIDSLPAAAHAGRPVREVRPDLAATLEPALREVLATGEPRLDVELRDGSHGPADDRRVWLADCHPLRGRRGEMLGVSAVVREVTEQRRAEARIRHLAEHDPLTGLPNRRLFEDRLAQALAGCRRRNGRGALLLLDLDRFKAVNDTFGHAAGDALLTEVAARLRGCVREVDTVARLGGDEFAVILVDLVGERDAEEVAERVRATLGRPVRHEGHDLRVGASIGIAAFSAAGPEPDTLLREADAALYREKAAERRVEGATL